MYGQNKVAKRNPITTGVINVVGVPWATIQGEGPYAGWPAVFVRLAGCNLRCTFCDTNFEDDVRPWDPVALATHLAIMAKRLSKPFVVVTGGEPMLQEAVVDVARLLYRKDVLVQVETAGTVWADGIERFATVVVSPKTPAICEEAHTYGDAFKYVIDVNDPYDSIDGLPMYTTQKDADFTKPLAKPRGGAPVYLSPCDPRPGDFTLSEFRQGQWARNHAEVAKRCMKYGHRATMQMHKYMNVD